MSTRFDRLSRRRVLALLAASCAGTAIAPAHVLSQETPRPSGPGVIDVHHHIYPPRYTRANLARLLADAPLDSASTYLDWTPEHTLEQMDQNGVAGAVTSITSPGIWFGHNDEGRRWARECNEYGARLSGDHAGRFGMLAAVPLPDTAGCLREIAYALTVLCPSRGLQHMKCFANNFQKIRIFFTRHRSVSQNTCSGAILPK